MTILLHFHACHKTYYVIKNTREIIHFFQGRKSIYLDLILIIEFVAFFAIIFTGNVYLLVTSWKHRRTAKAVMVTVGTSFIILSSWFPWFLARAVALKAGKDYAHVPNVTHCFNLVGKCLNPLVFIMSVRSIKRTVVTDTD